MHAAHVTNVRWTNDGRHAVSIGGADHALIVWKVDTERAADDDKDTSLTGSESVQFVLFLFLLHSCQTCSRSLRNAFKQGVFCTHQHLHFFTALNTTLSYVSCIAECWKERTLTRILQTIFFREYKQASAVKLCSSQSLALGRKGMEM